MTVSLDPAWKTSDDIEVMQSQLLRVMVDASRSRHPWYSPILERHGIVGRSIRHTRDLEQIPPTTKQTFIEHADRFRLEPHPDRPEDYVLADVTYTAGTSSGVPTPIYQTNYDLRAVLFAQRRMMDLRGVTRRDRVLNLYPLAPFPHGGWIRPTQAAASLGAPVVAATGGSPHHRFPVTRTMEEVVEVAVDTDPTVVWGVPSYVERVLSQAVESGRRLPSVRMIAVSGEPCSDVRRRTLVELAERAGAHQPAVSDSLGASELQFSLVECRDGGGFHHPAPELAHVDVVDDEGAAVPDGEPGRLTYTHLDRTGTVLLRFLVGDRVILERSPCPHCGWAGGRIVEHLGREGNLRKVRGALVNVDAVHRAIESCPDVLDHRIEIAVESGFDTLRTWIAIAPGAVEQASASAVVDAVRRVTGVRPDVQATDRRGIWDPDEQMKPARFRDLRTHATDDRTGP